MKIALCDDENAYITKFKQLILKSYQNTDKLSITEFDSGEKLLEQFQPNRFDVIVLDIEMKELTGLDVAKRIRDSDKSVILVFLTNHQEFAVYGYEFGAFRYILKDLPEMMHIKQLQSIFNQYHQSHITFAVETLNKVYNVSISDIIYFEIFKRIIVLHTQNADYRFYGRLSDIEKDERLINFIKPHKSYYINLAYIDNVEPKTVVMKNGDKIILSRKYKQSFTDRFVSFLTERC